ncbi:MAG: hypothetical protein Q7S21_04695 [archaeon]|nr:hypothetical protein [archaeon]
MKSSKTSSLTGVKLRGRIRKFGLENGLNVLAENASDVKGNARIAVIAGTKISLIEKFLKQIVPDSKIELKLKNISNPVLSKLKVNEENRYEI